LLWGWDLNADFTGAVLGKKGNLGTFWGMGVLKAGLEKFSIPAARPSSQKKKTQIAGESETSKNWQ